MEVDHAGEGLPSGGYPTDPLIVQWAWVSEEGSQLVARPRRHHRGIPKDDPAPGGGRTPPTNDRCREGPGGRDSPDQYLIDQDPCP